MFASAITKIASNSVLPLSEQSKQNVARKRSNDKKYIQIDIDRQSKLNSGWSTEQAGFKFIKFYCRCKTDFGWNRIPYPGFADIERMVSLPDCPWPRNNKSPVVGGPKGCPTEDSRCACQKFGEVLRSAACGGSVDQKQDFEGDYVRNF